MLKLRKPFFQNIQLHIGQELLQKLWDKYVQSSAPEYEKIQLVYLNRETGQEEEQARQIQIFVSFFTEKTKCCRWERRNIRLLWLFGIRRRLLETIQGVLTIPYIGRLLLRERGMKAWFLWDIEIFPRS